MDERIEFNGRVAVITGSGRGLGKAFAVALAARGASVVVNDVNADNARAVVGEIRDAGGRAIDCTISIASPEGGKKLVETAVEQFGSIDILVSNAGILDVDDFADLTPERIVRLHDTNLLGAWWVTQPAWRVMRERGYGRIVLVGSSTGLLGQRGNAHYGSSKAGIWGLMKALAFEAEAEENGIRVNLLLPGAQTGIASDSMPQFAEKGIDPGRYLFGEAADSFAALTSDPARADPALSAPMVAFLASEGCPVNGEAFTSSFGWFGRAFVGMGKGWLAPDPNGIKAEDIREHFAQIDSIAQFDAPKFMGDDMQSLARRIDGLQKNDAADA